MAKRTLCLGPSRGDTEGGIEATYTFRVPQRPHQVTIVRRGGRPYFVVRLGAQDASALFNGTLMRTGGTINYLLPLCPLIVRAAIRIAIGDTAEEGGSLRATLGLFEADFGAGKDAADPVEDVVACLQGAALKIAAKDEKFPLPPDSDAPKWASWGPACVLLDVIEPLLPPAVFVEVCERVGCRRAASYRPLPMGAGSKETKSHANSRAPPPKRRQTSITGFMASKAT